LVFARISSSLASSNPLTNLSDERFLCINELYTAPRGKLYRLSGEHSPDDGINDRFRQSYHQYDDKYSGGSECNESSLYKRAAMISNVNLNATIFSKYFSSNMP